ncbi:MAG: chain-length determining protein [Selenomonas ruminantium]|uniref:Chain-length determining protein n=1 Tax=Selenomonas ruminantium TaxID=971 RepID=A0A927WHJ5_SELRU|nr:chain-length determining protein [Selenomonas ruminantium]
MEKEEQIDIGKIWQIMKDRKKVCGAIIGGCTAISLVAALVWPPTYESTTTVQTRVTGAGVSGASVAAAALGLGSATSPTLSYVEMMKSNTVLQPIIDELDWDEDDKEFLTPEIFAKKNLQIENTKQTNLIKVTAKGKTPKEAQMISQHVVDNFLVMMTDMNKETQSLLVQFLNERVEVAKKEAEEARNKFAAYQKEHGIYSPDEQAKLAVTKMNAFDDAIGDMHVRQQSSQAMADSAAAQLGDINISSQSLKINNNENVQSLRAKIVDAEVNLVDLRQQYTEENPNVIKAEERLNALKQSLSQEVNALIASKYTTINPTQESLIKAQVNAQVDVEVSKASEAAVVKRRDEKAKELDNFPQEVQEYMNLQRDTVIKEGIYTDLIKQMENNKIRQAMDSMDIQVVDPANLPFEEKPTWPRKNVITVIGFVIGGMISMAYSLVVYKREA